jgi:hypothetical protein
MHHARWVACSQVSSQPQVVEARTDTPAMLEALQAIAAFYGQQQGGNTAEARKSLRQVGLGGTLDDSQREA